MAGRAKAIIVGLGARAGCFRLGLALQRLAFGPHYVRVLNYHETPAETVLTLLAQLQLYRRRFRPGRPADLEACLAGERRGDRPALLMTFDGGYRSHYTVAAPMLERYGFRGLFFVPEAFIAQTRAEAEANFAAAPGEPEPRMTWDECRELTTRGHQLGCCGRTHVRLSDDLTAEQLADEITRAGADIAERLGAPVEDFSWVGGEEWSYDAGAFDEIRRAAYRRVFMTNLYPVRPGASPIWIQRTNIESHWSRAEVEFYLSGLMDLAYAPKRWRLARKLLRRPAAEPQADRVESEARA